MAPSKVPLGTLHYVEQTVYKAEKALVAAKFNGIVLKSQKFDAQKDAAATDFLLKNPTGKVPYLETDTGCVFTSNAIARYIARCRADTPLYGRCFDDEGQVDTWLEFCTHELEVPLMTWVYPVLGLMEDLPQVTADAQADVKKALAVLEDRLKVSEYLVGNFLSLADIAIVCALKEGFARVFDPAFRKPFPKVSAWFEGCCKLPQFKSVLGDVKLCAQAEKPKPVAAPVAAKQAAPAKDQKAAAAPKAEAKAEKAKPKAEAKPAAKTQAPAAAPSAAAGGALDDKIKAVGDEIRTLKEKLKAEGLSGKKINDHDEVKKLVAQLQELKAQAEAGGSAAPAQAAPAAAPAAPAAAPAASSGAAGSLDDKIKAVGDEIRALKEKLKAEGLSGKKINDHDEVKKLVAQLQELKAQAA